MARGARRMTSLSRVQNVTTEALWNKAKSRKNLVFVHFATARTPAEVTKFINNLSKQPEYRRVTFIKFDMDKLAAVAAKAGVVSSPTFQCYRNNELLEGFAGLIPQKMLAMLDTHNKQTNKGGKGVPFGGSLVVLVAAAVALVFGLRRRSKQTFAALKPSTEEPAASVETGLGDEDDDEEDDDEEDDDEEDEEDEDYDPTPPPLPARA